MIGFGVIEGVSDGSNGVSVAVGRDVDVGSGSMVGEGSGVIVTEGVGVAVNARSVGEGLVS